MSAGAQLTLDASDYEHDPEDFSRERWENLYERYDGVVADVARHVGLTDSGCRKILTRLDIHEVDPNEPYQVAKLYPHEVGLAPLNCARCCEPEIREHPCPACGFDPRGDGDD